MFWKAFPVRIKNAKMLFSCVHYENFIDIIFRFKQKAKQI